MMRIIASRMRVVEGQSPEITVDMDYWYFLNREGGISGIEACHTLKCPVEELLNASIIVSRLCPEGAHG